MFIKLNHQSLDVYAAARELTKQVYPNIDEIACRGEIQYGATDEKGRIISQAQPVRGIITPIGGGTEKVF